MSNVPPPPPPGAVAHLRRPEPTAAAVGRGVRPRSDDAGRRCRRDGRGGGPSNLKIFAAEAVGTFVLMIVGPGTAILAVDAMGDARRRAGVRPRPAGDGVHDRPRLGVPHQPGGDAGRSWSAARSRWSRPGTTGSPRWSARCSAGCSCSSSPARATTTRPACSPPTAGAATSASRSGSGPAIVVEIFFTALLIFVVLSTTTKGYPVGFGGLAAGLTLAMIHLATIPVDNTSVNPARSLGTAIFGGGDALAQLWVFIVFPLDRRRARRARLAARARRAPRGDDVRRPARPRRRPRPGRRRGQPGGGPLRLTARRQAGVSGRPSGRSCLSRCAAFWAFFHSRTRGQRLRAGDVGDRAGHVVAEAPGGLPPARRRDALRLAEDGDEDPRLLVAVAGQGAQPAVQLGAVGDAGPDASRRGRRSRSASTSHSSWMRRPSDAGKRWIAGFSQHTATKSSTSIAAMRVASRWPRRRRSVAGPANAHSIGTCWSSSIPISSAVPSPLSSPSASASPVM